MSLEFNKVVDQVYKLGRMLDEIDLNAGNRLDLAIERFHEATDLDFIHKRVELTRRPDVSGYRGAAPLDPPYHEVICQIFPCPEIPASATIIAADGSQIYPAEQSPVHYFLVNIGLFTYHHGADRVPDQYSVPRLFFHKDHVHDASGRLLSHRTIDARRTAAEMHELSAKAWELRDEARPIIALYDNQLMFWASDDVTGARQLMQQYHGALVHLHDSGSILAGYIDNPTRSRVVIRLLHLLSLTDEEVHSSDLSSSRELEGVRDIQLFSSVLQPGERSAIMVQNSPRNFKYRQRGDSYEIAFFYLKVSSGYQ
ncbi:MAG: DNA double-strand break repair nuclease NurA, partial [Anaerolineae bacterium]|nr:DNA double-strand break repair nuclease NurA [Anaerolineae bacterium]